MKFARREEFSLHKKKETANTITAVPTPMKTEASCGSRFRACQGRNQKQSFPEQANDVAAKGSLSTLLPEKVELKSTPKVDMTMVDFRGMAKVQQRVCDLHPDLAICSKRYEKWREFAYGTLGELLFFLTSTRRKDMTQEKCERLQVIWEAAVDLGFDLTWLYPIIESSLDSGMERINCLENLKKPLEEERETLQHQLTTLTMQLCQVKGELAKFDEQIEVAKADLEFKSNGFLYQL